MYYCISLKTYLADPEQAIWYATSAYSYDAESAAIEYMAEREDRRGEFGKNQQPHATVEVLVHDVDQDRVVMIQIAPDPLPGYSAVMVEDDDAQYEHQIDLKGIKFDAALSE